MEKFCEKCGSKNISIRETYFFKDYVCLDCGYVKLISKMNLVEGCG